MPRFDDIQTYLSEAMQSWYCPGLAVAVLKGEEVIYKAALGYQNVEEQVPMTPQTRFAMASSTKPFAAMSIAQLVDDGLLEWDKPIRDKLPEIIFKDEYVNKHVTIRDMLCHRTGLPRHDLGVWRLDISRAEQIERLRHYAFSASFREKFQYNNHMYYAVAYIVERLSGLRWEDFIQQRIFDPLGMVASNFVPEPPQPGQVTSYGYRIERDEEGQPKGYVRMPYGKHTDVSPGAAGALFSTLDDLIEWLKVHVNGGQVGDKRIVSQANLDQMHQPQMIFPFAGPMEAIHEGTHLAAYGLGWFVQPHRGYTIIHHGGNVEGFSLMTGFVPKQQIGIVVLTNSAAMPLRDVLLYELADRALDLPDGGWNAKYHSYFDPMFAGLSRGKQSSAAEQIADAPPSHPLDAYVGTFAADGYPDFGVRQREDGSFEASTIGSLDWASLKHYHYDVFEWDLSDFDARMKVRFLTSDEGSIDSVSIPIEEAVDAVIFKRKPLELPAELIAALVGDYDPGIPGMIFTVSSKAGKLYAAATGGTAAELKPYRSDEKLVGLRGSFGRMDFVRDGAQITRLILRQGDMTLEAPRIS